MTETEWYAQPMRWLQLNLVPDDARRADVGAWKEYWREAQVEGLTIAAAGATAHYPTDVPLHGRSAYLDGRDLVGELVTAAKALDIRVLARFEAFFTSQEVADAHPDWIAQRRGMSVLSWLAAGRPTPCFNGPYFREFMPQVMSEIASRYPVDGFYANGWPFIGQGPPSPETVCSCPSCLEGWRARGHDGLPTVADPDDPVWADYVRYVQESYESVQRLWQRHVKAIRPGLSFVCNLHGSVASGVRWGEFGPLVDLFANDHQARRGVDRGTSGVMGEALWSASRSAAIVQGLADGKPMCHIVGAWHAAGPSLRRLGREPLEIRMMLAQVVARGARPWCNVGGGVVYDRRWMDAVRDYYRWHASAERYLRNERSLAEVGVVWTPEALWPEASDRQLAGGSPSLAAAVHGWHEALLRARVPFEVVPGFRMPATDLDRYRVLIVPSGSRVDLAGASALRRFVEGGGGLVLGCGVLHPTRGPAGGEEVLAGLAGVGVPAAPIGPRPTAYIEITATRDHPLLRAVGDADYLPAGDWCAPVLTLAGATGAGRYQHPLPFLADAAVVETPPPDDPMLTRHGRCVYLATDLDALHGTHQLPDVRTLLRNCLDAAFGDEGLAWTASGPGVVDVNVWQQASSWTVHLVNLTNPNLYAGPLDELTPIGAQTVHLGLDADAVAPHARLLRAGGTVPLQRTAGGTITAEVPAIEDFEVVAIDRVGR